MEKMTKKGMQLIAIASIMTELGFIKYVENETGCSSDEARDELYIAVYECYQKEWNDDDKDEYDSCAATLKRMYGVTFQL